MSLTIIAFAWLRSPYLNPCLAVEIFLTKAFVPYKQEDDDCDDQAQHRAMEEYEVESWDTWVNATYLRLVIQVLSSSDS